MTTYFGKEPKILSWLAGRLVSKYAEKGHQVPSPRGRKYLD